jgi:hypothetical protein
MHLIKPLVCNDIRFESFGKDDMKDSRGIGVKDSSEGIFSPEPSNPWNLEPFQ